MALDAAHPERIDDAPFWRIQADAKVLADRDGLSADLESLRVEEVPLDRRRRRRSAVTARDRNVGPRRDDVGKAMTSESSPQAQRRRRNSRRSCDQIEVADVGVGAAIEPAVDLFNDPGVAELVETVLGQSRSASLRVREGLTKRGDDCNGDGLPPSVDDVLQSNRIHTSMSVNAYSVAKRTRPPGIRRKSAANPLIAERHSTANSAAKLVDTGRYCLYCLDHHTCPEQVKQHMAARPDTD